MRIIDYPMSEELNDDDAFVIEGSEDTGTKKTNLGAIKNYVASSDISLDPVVEHRKYRGKFLGTEYTQEQKDAIFNGTFDDLYVGDYWTINDMDWIIADVDYWWNELGDEMSKQFELVEHHLVIVPRNSLFKAAINSDNTKLTGYVGSDMYTTHLPIAENIVNSAFGSDYILSHNSYLVNGISNTNGRPTSGLNVLRKVDLMNQLMVFGSNISTYSIGDFQGGAAIIYTTETQELSLFLQKPDLVFSDNSSYWLRENVYVGKQVTVSYANTISYTDANISDFGVRPVFAIRG